MYGASQGVAQSTSSWAVRCAVKPTAGQYAEACCVPGTQHSQYAGGCAPHAVAAALARPLAPAAQAVDTTALGHRVHGTQVPCTGGQVSGEPIDQINQPGHILGAIRTFQTLETIQTGVQQRTNSRCIIWQPIDANDRWIGELQGTWQAGHMPGRNTSYPTGRRHQLRQIGSRQERLIDLSQRACHQVMQSAFRRHLQILEHALGTSMLAGLFSAGTSAAQNGLSHLWQGNAIAGSRGNKGRGGVLPLNLPTFHKIPAIALLHRVNPAGVAHVRHI